MMDSDRPLVVWSIGHSSRAIGEFLALLQGQRIERIADVRRYAGSRAHPHFNPEPLAAALTDAGIEYCPFPELGGRRPPLPDSPNTIWRHPNFRGYADYMDSAEFRAGLERLVRAAGQRRTALLCSEAVWWRCHRAMIADALKAGGAEVLHIMERGKVVAHPYTAAASIVDGVLRYGAGTAGGGDAGRRDAGG
jgi:uncharacterized protein (DUF488 family)